VCAEERRELSLPAAAGGLKTMGYGRMATHRPGGVLPGGHSPSNVKGNIPGALYLDRRIYRPNYYCRSFFADCYSRLIIAFRRF
jgi:hypothetical protein